MRVPTAKIEGAAVKQTQALESLSAMNSVLLDTEKKRLIATDGRILAVIPAEVEDTDTAGLIPPAAWAAARRLKAQIVSVNSSVKIYGARAGAETAEFIRPTGTFPNVDRELTPRRPKADDGSQAEDGKEFAVVLALDAALLLCLAEALVRAKGRGYDNPKARVVQLYITDSQTAIYVRAPGEADSEGLIMPCERF